MVEEEVEREEELDEIGSLDLEELEGDLEEKKKEIRELWENMSPEEREEAEEIIKKRLKEMEEL